MANVLKLENKQISAIIAHNLRTLRAHSNDSIDPARLGENYILSPDRGVSEYEYYLQRKAELYCYNREDVKTAFSWIITAPKDLPREHETAFFKSCYDFMTDKYGAENCVLAVVHADEDEEKGAHHMHAIYIPAVEDKKHGGEKINCSQVINRKSLRKFHDELKLHLEKDGINARVKSGITRRLGNKSVAELKAESRQKEERQQTVNANPYKGYQW